FSIFFYKKSVSRKSVDFPPTLNIVEPFFARTLSVYPRFFRKKGALDGVFLFRKCYDRKHEEAYRQTIGAFLFTK
ncbi:hypothetical protein, partial [Enterococcus casseliflavus]|uniref:hypothetical protein n=1 Tax=Enterococcus casseliflavus TaxID=37734 RepID=UPI003D0D4F8E